MACTSHPFTFHVQAADAFVGQDRVKVRQCRVDVSKAPLHEEFDIVLNTTYWNSLQAERELWLGVIGYAGSLKASQLLLFPEGRPFKEYWLTVALPRQGERDSPEQPFDGERVCRRCPQRRWVYWEVRKPREDHVYRLHWKW
jgi:hypothetical protein